MNRLNFSLTLLVLLILSACSNHQESKYLRWVGDSVFDPETDDEKFEICTFESEVKQYFNFSQGLQYDGEKTAILDHFEAYEPVAVDQSGWIRIRFVVNCKGETG